MNIGFDAKRAFFNPSGLGNYSRTLINSLSEFFPEHHYFLYLPKRKVNIGENLFSLQNNMTLRVPPSARDALWGGNLWRSVYMGNQIKRDNLAIYHGLSHELPLNIKRGNAKNVVTIHDLIFLKHPEFYPIIDRFIYRQKCLFACRNADKIVAISEQTKSDIVNSWGIDPKQISVVYQSCDPDFYAYNDNMLLQHGFFVQQTYELPYNLPEQYVLHIGGMQARKNLLGLLKAVEALKNRITVPIVAMNNPADTPYAQSVRDYIAQHDLGRQVILLDRVPQAHLPALYRCAAAICYPSVAEGWGLPIVEGLFSRVPVIAARGLEEAGGSHTQYIDPDNIEQFAHTLEQVLNTGSLRMDMILNGWAYAQQFKRQATAEAMMNLYNSLR
jgi:glycosyltransferase involved in cell wall biosynthesis